MKEQQFVIDETGNGYYSICVARATFRELARGSRHPNDMGGADATGFFKETKMMKTSMLNRGRRYQDE
jgi:hypothetical protein